MFDNHYRREASHSARTGRAEIDLKEQGDSTLTKLSSQKFFLLSSIKNISCVVILPCDCEKTENLDNCEKMVALKSF